MSILLQQQGVIPLEPAELPFLNSMYMYDTCAAVRMGGTIGYVTLDTNAVMRLLPVWDSREIQL